MEKTRKPLSTEALTKLAHARELALQKRRENAQKRKEDDAKPEVQQVETQVEAKIEPDPQPEPQHEPQHEPQPEMQQEVQQEPQHEQQQEVQLEPVPNPAPKKKRKAQRIIIQEESETDDDEVPTIVLKRSRRKHIKMQKTRNAIGPSSIHEPVTPDISPPQSPRERRQMPAWWYA